MSSYTALLATVKDLGLFRRQPWFYLGMGIALALGLLACIAGFVLLGDSWFQLFVAAGLGILSTQIAFLGHEASHRQIFASGPANDRTGRVLSGMVGVSYSWWMNKHTRHHGNPNVIGKDPDIAQDTVSFLPEHARETKGLHAWLTRRQAWAFFPLLTLEGINLHFRSFVHLFTERKVEKRSFEIAMIASRLGLVAAAAFVFLPFGMAFAFLAVEFAVFGVYMGASFVFNHTGMTLFPEGSKVDYLRKQVLSSRNISGGWFMTILFGGLNLQAEHHLFPNMSRPGLMRVKPIVMEHCKREGVVYTERSLPKAYREVLAYLNTVGRLAPDPFRCPVVTEYGRL
jgi:fatty acid desaturase